MVRFVSSCRRAGGQSARPFAGQLGQRSTQARQKRGGTHVLLEHSLDRSDGHLGRVWGGLGAEGCGRVRSAGRSVKAAGADWHAAARRSPTNLHHRRFTTISSTFSHLHITTHGRLDRSRRRSRRRVYQAGVRSTVRNPNRGSLEDSTRTSQSNPTHPTGSTHLTLTCACLARSSDLQPPALRAARVDF